ncbi:MAG: carboxymuconolactone decarboxylase family protein [Armatimonadetes bacterium]|nr:MAG: carboxymuconolactone decarboxylase family protein [Armatimonadota bacterium]GIV01831.1 MAG: hypothetical protein KatS3mg015_0661 [Fimbriimonadales bacterium]
MAKLPKRYTAFLEKYPEIGNAYHSLGEAVSKAGPLDAKTVALVKLGLSIGAKMEGAVHSHTRKALEAGASPDEIRHVALLSTPTLGFPNMMAALSWIEDVLDEQS